MKHDPMHEADRWLKQAKHDVSDADYSLAGRRFNLACFLYQQSAEKALKAFLYSKGLEDVWGHSAGELCAKAGKYDKSFKNVLKEASSLDKYYIPTRYPNGLPGGIPAEIFLLQDAKDARACCSKVIKLITGKI